MKIQIDTNSKTIKVENNVNLKAFEKQLKQIKAGLVAMGEDWEKYSLETNVVINNWTSPIIVRPYSHPYPWWNQPYYGTTGGGVTYDTTTETRKFDVPQTLTVGTDGIINLECPQ